jgi:phosphoenolpyruvate---glycerone phosphotransferase subunit DhaL
MIDSEAALQLFAEMADTLHGELTALDQVSGDGDFGDNLCDALARVVAELHGQSTQDGDQRGAFLVAGSLFLDTVGGTSGPLFGLLFHAIGRALEQTTQSADRRLASGVAEGLAAVQRVGEAAPGDRTMVDALAPAAEALSQGGDLVAAAEAAYDGARRTADMRARLGRASYVGDRAVGSPDPGAVGIALLFRALAEVEADGRGCVWTLPALVATHEI